MRSEWSDGLPHAEHFHKETVVSVLIKATQLGQIHRILYVTLI
jgi:hypothetical protein